MFLTSSSRFLRSLHICAAMDYPITLTRVGNCTNSSSIHLSSSTNLMHTVLGPLLFLIYIDGVEKVTLSDGTIILYADDMVLYRPIYSQEDYWLLQQDINAVARWISGNHLQFNFSKCKYMTLSRKRASDLPPPINLNSLPLDRVTEFKYLGLRISADLSWSPHINMICAKARRLVGMLYRRFYQDADTSTLRQLYVSNIRPHLEYACQVWDPYLKKDIDSLESVQKFAMRVCSKQWDADYPTLLSSLNLPTLAARRKRMKLCIRPDKLDLLFLISARFYFKHPASTFIIAFCLGHAPY